MKVGIIVQARMGSSRLPGKVLMKIQDKTILEHVFDRLKQCKKVDEIILATTLEESDNPIAGLNFENVNIFRGDEMNVLSRYYEAASLHHLDVVVRVTSDCPLIDPNLIDSMVEMLISSPDINFVSNAGQDPSQRTYPRGLDVEVFYFSDLKHAYETTQVPYHKEHVTPYLYENCDNIYYYLNDVDYSKYRLTLDTQEDYDAINRLYKYLYKGQHDFYLKEIVDCLEMHPEIAKINKEIKQKSITNLG